MRAVFLLTLAFALPISASAVSIGGAQSLSIQPSARSAGMADCTLAVVDDASASSWNPGGLAFMKGDLNLIGSHSNLVPDWDDVYYWYFAGAYRVSPQLTVAASLTYLTYGEQVVMHPTEPIPMDTLDSFERIPSIACAYAIGEHIGLGLNVKYVYVDLALPGIALDQTGGTGSAFAADLGGEFRTNLRSGDLSVLVRGSGVVQNLGQKLKVGDNESTLPKCARVGASGQLSYATLGHALICAHYDQPLIDGWNSDANGIWGVGAEVEVSVLGTVSQLGEGEQVPVRDFLSGRIGYYKDEDGQVEGRSYGFGGGLDIQGKAVLRVDFARVPQAEGLKRTWRVQGSGWITF